MDRPSRQITDLLEAWAEGDLDALDELMPLVFDDLHRMARFFFQRESETHTLQATALVSELYFLLKKQRKITWANRRAFFGFASEVMQHFLIDYARKQQTQKRGGHVDHVGLEEIAHHLGREPSPDLVLDLRRALDELAEIDPILAEVVRLRFIVGLQIDETAEVLGISEPTVKRKWVLAKLWLIRRLSEGNKASRDAGAEEGTSDDGSGGDESDAED